MTPVSGEGAHGTCPGCGTTAYFDDARRGDPVVCPSCGAMFDARLRSAPDAVGQDPPIADADADAVAVAPAPAPLPSASPGAATAPSLARGHGREIAIAAGAGVLVLLLALVARQLLRDPGQLLTIEAKEGSRLHTRARAELRFERVTERAGFTVRQTVLQVDEREQFDTVSRVSDSAVHLSRIVTRASRQQLGDAGLVISDAPSPLQHRTLAVTLAHGRAVITDGAPPDVPRETHAFVAIALPAEPVWPGDRWSLGIGDLYTLLELNALRISELRGAAECRFDALETIEAVRCARLAVDVQASWRDADQDAVLDARGTVRLWYSLAHRRFFIVDGDVPVTVRSGNAAGPGNLKVTIRVLPR